MNDRVLVQTCLDKQKQQQQRFTTSGYNADKNRMTLYWSEHSKRLAQAFANVSFDRGSFTVSASRHINVSYFTDPSPRSAIDFFPITTEGYLSGYLVMVKSANRFFYFEFDKNPSSVSVWDKETLDWATSLLNDKVYRVQDKGRVPPTATLYGHLSAFIFSMQVTQLPLVSVLKKDEVAWDRFFFCHIGSILDLEKQKRWALAKSTSSWEGMESACLFSHPLFVKHAKSNACVQKFTPEGYQEMTPLRPGILAYLLRTVPTATYAGELRLLVQKDGAATGVVFSDNLVASRGDTTKYAILVNLQFGVLSKDMTGSSSHVLKQYLAEKQVESKAGIEETGHACAMIVDPVKKSIKYFEPNGSTTPWTRSAFLALQEHAVSNVRRTPWSEWKSYVWISPEDFCPVEGIQARAKGLAKQMCAYLSMALVFLELSCNYTMEEILDKIPDVDSFAAQWHCFLSDIADQIQIRQAHAKVNQARDKLKDAQTTYSRLQEWYMRGDTDQVLKYSSF